MAKNIEKKAVIKSKTAKEKEESLQRQLKMPVSYTTDGVKMATLEEHINSAIPTLQLGEMSAEQRADVVVQRILSQKNYEITMPGVGTLDKERAIAEVKANSNIGKTLIEIEQRVINDLVQRTIPKEVVK
jgi:hypothetical protein